MYTICSLFAICSFRWVLAENMPAPEGGHWSPSISVVPFEFVSGPFRMQRRNREATMMAVWRWFIDLFKRKPADPASPSQRRTADVVAADARRTASGGHG